MNTASVKPGLGVHGEHHPGGAEIGADHLLHPGRQRHRLVREGVVHPVGDRAVVVQRREHLPDRDQDRRRCRARSRTSPADRRTTRPAGPPPSHWTAPRTTARLPARRRRPTARTRRGCRSPDPAGNGCVTTASRISCPDRSQRLHVVGVQSRQPGADPLRQTGVADEPAVRLRRRGEPVRHPHPQPGQVRRSSPPATSSSRPPAPGPPAQVREPANVGRAVDRGVTGHG